MDESHRLSPGSDRIDELDRSGAAPTELLGQELRSSSREAEALTREHDDEKERERRR